MSHHLAQVQSVIQQSLAHQINEFLTGDEGLVTVNFVEVQPDLKAAIVWIIFERPENSQRVIQALNNHRRIFQKHLANTYNFKYTPVLTFKIDEAQTSQDSIEKLFGRM